MSYHRFATLSEQGESGLKSPEFEALFASDVTLFSPFLLKSINDKALAVRFISEVFTRVGTPKFVQQFTDDQNTTLFLWEGHIQGPDGRDFVLEGSLAITEGEDGLIHKVVSYLRPLQVGALIIKEMMMSAATVLPKDYWEATRSASAS